MLLLASTVGFATADDAKPAPAAVKEPKYDPTSRYESLTLRGWPLLVNKRLFNDKPELWAKTREVLDQQLFLVERVVPEKSLVKLKTVRLWIEDVEPHHPCMCYHPGKGWLLEHDMNPEKEHGVEVSNAATFLRWTIAQPFMVLHELAHAFHHQFLPEGFENPDVLTTFKAARERKDYDKVLRIGGTREKAYAMSNQQEYFAECSEAFFGTNDFYPYVRSELREHDAAMEALLKRLWE